MKFLLGIALALGIAATAYGAAAALHVSGGFIQQGTTDPGTLQCDTSGVSTHYWTSAVGGEMKLLKVWVSGIDPACAGGGELDVILKDSGGNQIWFGQSALPSVIPATAIEAGTAGNSGPLTNISLTSVESITVAVYDTTPAP